MTRTAPDEPDNDAPSSAELARLLDLQRARAEIHLGDDRAVLSKPQKIALSLMAGVLALTIAAFVFM